MMTYSDDSSIIFIFSESMTVIRSMFFNGSKGVSGLPALNAASSFYTGIFEASNSTNSYIF